MLVRFCEGRVIPFPLVVIAAMNNGDLDRSKPNRFCSFLSAITFCPSGGPLDIFNILRYLLLVVTLPLLTISANAIEPYPGWSNGVKLSTGKVIYSSPVVAELDGILENGKEIVVATANGYLHALHSDGSLYWEAALPNANCDGAGDTNKVLSSPSVGELHGDGVPYVVIGYGGVGGKDCGGGVVAHHGRTGEQHAHFNLKKYNDAENYWSFSYTVFSTPALFDTNRDGTLEIGFGSFDRRTYLLPHTVKVPIWTSIVADTVWSSAAFAFIGNESTASMFIGTDISRNDALVPPTPNGGYLYRYHTTEGVSSSPGGKKKSQKRAVKKCKKIKKKKKRRRCRKRLRSRSLNLRAQNTISYGFRDPDAYEWYQEFNQVLYSAPIVADVLPGVSDKEVITGFGCFFPQESRDKRGKHLKIVSSKTGKTLRTLEAPGCNESSPIAVDVDGDGQLEVFATFNGNTNVGGDGTGRLVGWNPVSGEELWRATAGGDDYASFKYSPIAGDLNGDGGQELVVANGGSVRIFDGTEGTLLRCDGSSCAGGDARLRFSSTGRNTPVMADIDGDGDLELIAAGGGKVFVWHNFEDLKGSTAGLNEPYTSDWPMWRGNAARTASLK